MAISPASISLSNSSNASCTMSSVSQPAATPWLNWASSLNRSDPRAQILFFKRLKETSPESLKDFAPLYYGFMNEFHSLLFT